MKYIWIITLTICTLYSYKCPHGCEIQHEHISKNCKDSLIAFKDKKEVIEFYKNNYTNIKKIDSLNIK